MPRKLFTESRYSNGVNSIKIINDFVKAIFDNQHSLGNSCTYSTHFYEGINTVTFQKSQIQSFTYLFMDIKSNVSVNVLVFLPFISFMNTCIYIYFLKKKWNL